MDAEKVWIPFGLFIGTDVQTDGINVCERGLIRLNVYPIDGSCFDPKSNDFMML